MDDLWGQLFPFSTPAEDAIHNWKMQDSLLRSTEIGMIKQDREKVLNYARMIYTFGLKADAPHYTGNLMTSGINIEEQGPTACDIVILAPGQTAIDGSKLPDYGWQTDMLDRLQFYNEDLEYIDVPNKNKDWVERSLYRSSEKLINKFEGGYD